MDITSYIMGSIAGAKSASGLKYLVVDTLPETGADNTIYLVPKSTSKTNNYYDEYMYISNAWELIGDTEIDLSNYLQEEDLKTINGNSIVGSGDLEIEAPSNYLGKTSVYNTQETALNLNELSKGAYIFKHDSNNNKLWLKATYKLSSSAEPTTQYLEINLFDDITSQGKPNTRVALNELILYIDTPIDESTVGTPIPKTKGSLTTTISDKNRNLANNFKTLAITSGGMVVSNNTYEDFNIIQTNTLPTASAENVGRIVQYTGTTDSTYTNGYFYQCVSDGQSPATYSWSNLSVQAGGDVNYVIDKSGVKTYIITETYPLTGMYSSLKEYVEEWLRARQDINPYPKLIILGNQYRTGYYVEDSVLPNGLSLRTIVNKTVFTNGNYTLCEMSNLRSTMTMYWDATTHNITTLSFNSRNEDNLNFLKTTNTISYTPTGDYNPATKKYVDDSIASAIGTALGGSY